MKRIICAAIAIIVVVVSAFPASALDFGCNVDTVSKAVYLENLDTGITVFEKNSTERMYPASTTKIMTYILTAENVSDLDSTTVTVREDVISSLDPESTVMGLSDHIGEQVSVRDLLYGLMLPSGNDAALLLADYIGGSIDSFVGMMNNKAAELGCFDTHFANPHGLFDPDHYSTAADMAIIAKYALDVQGFKETVGTVYYTPSGYEELHNTNYMLDSSYYGGYYYYSYVKGIKTGFLDEAGRCLVTYAENDGYTYLCVALGAEYSYEEDINYAMLDSRDLYNWAFSSLANRTVYGPGETVRTIPVKYAKDPDEQVELVPASTITAFLPDSFDTSLVTVDVQCSEEAEAPVAKGDLMGTVTVSYDGVNLGTADVVADEDIERDNFRYTVSKIIEFITDHLMIFIIAAVVLVLLIIILCANARRRRRARERARARRRFKD